MDNITHDAVTGWRARLGWICPSVHSSQVDLDFYTVVPPSIEVKTVTLGITALNDQEVAMALQKIDDAAKRLVIAGAQFIAVQGTPLVVSKGFGFDQELIKRVEGISHLPATTCLTSSMAAFRVLNVKKILMVSPQTPEIDQRIAKFLRDNGFDVVHVKTLNMQFNRDIRALPHSAAYTAARQAFQEAPQAEGVYIPCGEWCPPWVVDSLERDLGVPVINARQSSTWLGLKTLQIKEPIKGWGKIFDYR